MTRKKSILRDEIAMVGKRQLKNSFIIVLILSMIGTEAFSQIDSLHIARNIMYVEVAGFGGYGSVNYERVVYNKKSLMFSLRLGMSSYHIKDYSNKINPDMLIPIALYGCYGAKHKIELGVGQTFANIVHADLSDFKSKRKTNFHSNISIGYRYQKDLGGLFFRCAYTPIIEYNRYFRHWAGFSFGYSF